MQLTKHLKNTDGEVDPSFLQSSDREIILDLKAQFTVITLFFFNLR